MGLKINKLRLRAVTESGTFGADLSFDSGLCVISAGNTKGKSTCLNALIYCLGLERMLGPKRQIPLAHAMQSSIKDDLNQAYSVLESYVLLEISNHRGETLTLRRIVKGEADNRLISTWEGGLSGEQPLGKRRDYYVLDPGAATRGAGFHRYLADFIGWELPTVGKFDGSESLLYIETLFPLFFVEQKSGWTAIPASFPTYLGIREMSKRAVEFLMGFQSHEVELQRQRLRVEAASLATRWSDVFLQLRRVVADENGRVEGLPSAPQAEWPPAVEPSILVPVADEWQQLTAAKRELRLRVESLNLSEIPSAEQAEPGVSRELQALTSELQRLGAAQTELLRRMSLERSQRASIAERMRLLEEDLRKNQDAKKLVSLGSDAANALSASHCPTCHQSVSDVLLPQEALASTMTLDENISFIREQLEIVREASASSAASLEKTERLLSSLHGEIMESRARIRALKQTLVQASGMPAIAVIQERVTLEERVRRLERLQEQAAEILGLFTELADKYRSVLAQQERLPKTSLIPEDLAKLAAIEASLRTQTRLYGFSTFAPADLSIAPDSYRPIREGFDIGFELSASDAIRLKWAYQMSLLEVGYNFATNHPHILVLDEPGQQEVEKPSLGALLRRAAASKERNQQVIITTSEDRSTLRASLVRTEHQLIEVDGYLLQPIT